MNKPTAALVSVGSVLVATLIGGSFGPQRPHTALWYARLRKPSYTPPGPAIGAAWSLLDVLLGLTGFRLMTRRSSAARSVALGCWWASVAGLAGYPAMFFGRKRVGESAVVATAMFASASGTAAAAARVDGVAAVSSIPLAVWTGFAVLLSEEIWRRN